MRPFPLLAWLVVLGLGPPLSGQETPADCGVCHDEAEEFTTGPHGGLMPAEIVLRSCVTCHGPGAEHLEDPTTENIRRLPAAEACASCHPGQEQELWLATPGHARQGVACLDCHASGHKTHDGRPWDPATEFLLAREPALLCAGCHGLEAAAFKRPYAHREGREAMACTECHSPHGSRRIGRLALLGNGGPCIDCHTAQAGPFIFPHPPRDVDGCVACHEPHGSTNPRLLHRRRITNLCLECHANTPAFHDLSQARFRACSSCHVAVHGSNRDPRLFDN